MAEEAESQQVEWFGGALTVELPKSFADIRLVVLELCRSLLESLFGAQSGAANP